MSMRRKWIITGSNRGIGLALTNKLVERGHSVIAVCRNPQNAEYLTNIKQQNPDKCFLYPNSLDVSIEENVKEFKNWINKETKHNDITGLINNAGVLCSNFGDRFEQVNAQNVAKEMQVNALGPLHMCLHLIPTLINNHELNQSLPLPLVINMASGWSSIERNTEGNVLGYRMSKAALNQLTRSLHSQYNSKGCFISQDPGWIRTSMGSEYAPVSPNECAEGLVPLFEQFEEEDSGKLLDRKGKPIPW